MASDANQIADKIRHFSNNTFSLKEYQVDGLSFLIRAYKHGRGVILADEMGLGKTCQAIAFMLYVASQSDGKFRFLVVCPLSVMDDWKNEILRVGCGLEVVLYRGTAEERADLRRNLLKSPTWRILLTNYEMPIKDTGFFERWNWKLCVVDEAHRLKNSESLLHKTLKDFHVESFLLLTGTPIQNDLDELYSLLSFIDRKKFSVEAKEQFIRDFKCWKDNDPEKLRAFVRLYMLRRTKEAVLCNLPAMHEVVVYHGLTQTQKELYVAILMRNLGLIDLALASKQKLLNTLIQLRKCVDHPYLFEGIEPEPFEEGDHLILSSGKLILLDAILSHLSKTGHKVLIFSQMTRMLDVVQDYMAYKNYTYERLDGSVRGEERYASIKRFNKDRDTFCFLLSTRAGGLGVTLTAADTVVFLDSDFNPQNDIQAAARAHRIGQDRPVKVIRLIGRDTVEEYVLNRAYSKLKLTNVILNNDADTIGAANLSTAEISEMLMHGLRKFDTKEDADQSGSLNEREIIELIGDSASNGFWEIKEAVDNQQELKLPKNLDFYDFEGENYRKFRESDREAFKVLTEKMAASSIFKPGGRHDRLARSDEFKQKGQEVQHRRQEENKQKRVEAAAKIKAELWQEHGYESHALQIESHSYPDEDNVDSVDNLDIILEIAYLSGDVTDPRPAILHKKQPRIIVHCLDDSGEWGYGGIFDALRAKYPAVVDAYELASAMKDVKIGDVHLLPTDDSSHGQKSTKNGDFVALIIAQSYKNRDVIKYDALELALNKLGRYASKNKCTVHLPRIGYGLAKFNWYGIERLIRKYLADRSVPTYIYYYSRKMAVNDPDLSPAIDENDKPCTSRSVLNGKYSTTGQSSEISDYCSDDNEPHATKKPRLGCKKLPDLFTSIKFCFYECKPDVVNQFGRFITAYNGSWTQDLDDDDITHVIVENAYRRTDVDSSSIAKKKIVSLEWLEKCIRHRQLFGE